MNTANKLTILRILVVPFFMYFLLTGQMWLAITAFAFASITDNLDGYVARKYNQVTNFGKFMDPLADKILIIAALLCFMEKGYPTPAWAVFIIMARDFMVTGIRLLAVSEGKIVIDASIWGKLKTVAQIIAVFALMLDGITPLDIYGFKTATALFALCVTLTVISGVDYFKKSYSLMKFK